MTMHILKTSEEMMDNPWAGFVTINQEPRVSIVAPWVDSNCYYSGGKFLFIGQFVL